jgi:two-component system, NarL family, sensor histidine kinase UhpB
MAASIEELTRDLEHKVHTRTLDLEAARDEALKSNAEKRRLIEKVQSVVEEERKYIAREIHDHLNAVLIAIRLEAQRVLTLSEKGDEKRQLEELSTRARSIVTMINDLYQSTRSIVRQLRPEVLDALGLRGAVEELVKSYDDLHSGCDFELEVEGSFHDLPEDLPIVVYRLIQEALSNVVRHASARQTKVHLKHDESALAITIQDNGVGFEPNEASGGVGLVGMRERVQSLGGGFAISSQAGGGTTINIQLPLIKPQVGEA